jgi:hypothetical protein
MTEKLDTTAETAEVIVEPVEGPKPDAPQQPQQPQRKGGFILPVAGGVIAAVLGFGLAQYYPIAGANVDVEALKAALAKQTTEVSALQDQVNALSAAAQEPKDTGLTERVAAVEQSLTEIPAPSDLGPITARLDGVDQMLNDLDQKIASGSAATPNADPVALAQLRAEVEALKSTGLPVEALSKATASIDAKVSEVDAKLASVTADAQALAKATDQRAALRQVQAALDSGGPFEAALADLADLTVPQILADNAKSGLPSLQSLRDGFPEAARAAMDASLRADMGETWTDRVSAFLRTQTGARSLSPRDGTDPDAVLSRAEAGLAIGDLDAALTELSALPAEGQAAMASWLAKAKLRSDATAAIRDIVANSGL